MDQPRYQQGDIGDQAVNERCRVVAAKGEQTSTFTPRPPFFGPERTHPHAARPLTVKMCESNYPNNDSIEDQRSDRQERRDGKCVHQNEAQKKLAGQSDSPDERENMCPGAKARILPLSVERSAEDRWSQRHTR